MFDEDDEFFENALLEIDDLPLSKNIVFETKDKLNDTESSTSKEDLSPAIVPVFKINFNEIQKECNEDFDEDVVEQSLVNVQLKKRSKTCRLDSTTSVIDNSFQSQTSDISEIVEIEVQDNIKFKPVNYNFILK